jgi:urocanate hydratase
VVASLKQLNDDETLLLFGGRPAGILPTHQAAPRVLLASYNPVVHRAGLQKLREREPLETTMFGQAAAESWAYVGSLGFLQCTYKTFAAVARQNFNGSLAGKLIVSGGLGGAGGAQPLAAALNGAAFLGIEADGGKIKRRIRAGFCDYCVNSLDEALRILKNAVRQKQPVSVGLEGNCADIVPELARRGVLPDILTDQTSAHDLLNGYIPAGLSLPEAEALRRINPENYLQRARDSIARHVTGMLELQKLGAVTFEFGNYLRATAYESGGVKGAFNFPGFVAAYLRPLFTAGRARLLTVALSGEPGDIRRIDDLLRELFPNDAGMEQWIRLSGKHVRFQGLPARTCVLGPSERAQFAGRLNDLVGKGEIKAPVVVARADLDPVATRLPFSPSEKITEIADPGTQRPLLKALLNAAPGSSWIGLHSNEVMDGGSACHVIQATVADGHASTTERLEEALTKNLADALAGAAAAHQGKATNQARRDSPQISPGSQTKPPDAS